jgi:hypothetical protein
MSSIAQATLSKLQTWSSSKNSKLKLKASRSINPEFPHISKLDDVTRYNSANFNVYSYKDYPNRSGTPINPGNKPRSIEYETRKSPKKEYIKDLMRNTGVASPEAKKLILVNALSAELKVNASLPKITTIPPGPEGSVMNDFHKRETNPGYARNGSGGGFYTR